ncbi:MAG: L-seryl-tRNA(Sec) selenium transferase [Eubacteriales bacterium]
MNNLLRSIPKVDRLLADLPHLAQTHGTPMLTQAIRAVIHRVRAEILSGHLTELPSDLTHQIEAELTRQTTPSLRPVINGTGIILHTNLGRAPLSTSAVSAITAVAQGYSTLEYNVETGARGERYSHVTPLLQTLTGAESALVVNNNAAAVLLMLSALTKGGEVITSRGELVEIGGSFRVPEIMEACGCTLREVGATNKTHLRDYESAITEHTQALLKVHTSNYKIMGFTQAVPLAELVALGAKHHLPVLEDLGSGSLCNLDQFGISDEPTVQDSIQSGIDLVTFSGDKLLGGPQCGIIVGKKCYLDILKKHPLTRAMRVDKMTLAALEATLNSYLKEQATTEIPVLSMLSETPTTLEKRAKNLCNLLKKAGISAKVQPDCSEVGGGSVPTQTLPTLVVAVETTQNLQALTTHLRHRSTPIIGRISHDQFLLDLRTLTESEFPEIVSALAEVLS